MFIMRMIPGLCVLLLLSACGSTSPDNSVIAHTVRQRVNQCLYYLQYEYWQQFAGCYEPGILQRTALNLRSSHPDSLAQKVENPHQIFATYLAETSAVLVDRLKFSVLAIDVTPRVTVTIAMQMDFSKNNNRKWLEQWQMEKFQGQYFITARN